MIGSTSTISIEKLSETERRSLQPNKPQSNCWSNLGKLVNHPAGRVPNLPCNLFLRARRATNVKAQPKRFGYSSSRKSTSSIESCSAYCKRNYLD